MRQAGRKERRNRVSIMNPLWLHLLIICLHGIRRGVASNVGGIDGDPKDASEEKRAWACYGTFHNFLDISCPPDRQVALVAMMNGAKPVNRQCPDMTTSEENFQQDCCSFSEGDCVIRTHPNNFPVECSNLHFCRPQSRLANTGPTCNSNDFPTFTHYTEITYRCVIPPKETSESPTTTTTTMKTSTMEVVITASNGSVPSNRPSTTGNTATVQYTQRGTETIVMNVVDDSDFTPAMIGGMVAGIVGLMLTIFIFMFYWGRKRQVRISGRPQTNVWDYLLANTMSVRAFRGYDNFSSTSRHSLSSEDGGGGGGGGSSPVIRKTVWLPNISLDSGQGGSSSVITSDDNVSVVTVEQHSSSSVVAGGDTGAGLGAMAGGTVYGGALKRSSLGAGVVVGVVGSGITSVGVEGRAEVIRDIVVNRL